MTDNITAQQAKQLANALNLYDLVDNTQSTGQILLVDAKDRFVLINYTEICFFLKWLNLCKSI